MVVTVVLGDLLARQIVNLIDGPGLLNAITNILVRIGARQPDSTYDLDGVVLLVILLLSIVLVGVVVWAINSYLRRRVQVS
ncbi:hypothetical protein BWP39_03200 [Paraburkholderia acidicola]|uniref:Uncharacterized protein n=1 Tax=Paraburkholderia acidicola TaxID=1912599 RepID=A0A2A4F4L3_9BURK|nr:hypothetical protein BWP39_03200 [Paraburkholderia acidicola]